MSLATDRAPRRRERLLAAAATAGLLAFAFIGRAVLSADDGADMMSDTLGFLVQGRFECASIPPAGPDPYVAPPPPFRSRYGLLPSLVPLPFLAPVWPFRRALGAAAVDACAALTWAAGALLAALAFHRLARALKPGASPLWVPAFLGGTFLWAYVAGSYVESWAAAGLAVAAAALLSPRERPPAAEALAVAGGALVSFALRPVTWLAAPVLLLAALLEWKGRPDASRRALWLSGGLAAGLAVVAAITVLRSGSATDLGYGFRGGFPFVHPLLDGFLGLTLLPGRGVLLYAPIVIAALAMAPRLGWPARLVCFGVPLTLVLVDARWLVWHGGACWGPRHLLPVLPLLAAPAVLAPRRVAVVLLTLGGLLNLPGVLVSVGIFQGYAERLTPPPGEAWPAAGGDRVSEVASLSPLVGHPWLLASALTTRRLPAPWLALGARENLAPPPLGMFLSPWLARRAAGLAPVTPFVPRLLIRGATGYLMRGRPIEAERFAEEALALAPSDRDAARLLAQARAAEKR